MHVSRLAGAALVALALSIPAPTGAPGGTAAAQDGGLCSVSGSSDVSPLTVVARDSVPVDLQLAGQCPDGSGARADILLLIDRSTSMGEDGKLAAAHHAVTVFVNQVDFSRHRIGLVPFHATAQVFQPLTTDRDRLLSALAASGAPERSTNIARAIDVADAELSNSARPGAVRVIILLTDGKSNEDAMAASARAARANGTVIFVVALGPDADRSALGHVASSAAHLAYAPTNDTLEKIYSTIAGEIATYSVVNVRIVSELAQGAALVPGSSRPMDPSGSRTLAWELPVLQSQGTQFAYRLQLNLPGTYRPSVRTFADYTDGDGVRRRYEFPPLPLVEVLPAVGRTVHLPFTVQGACFRGLRGIDLVVAVDASSSMQGAPLEAARRAAVQLVTFLEPARDRAAVVRYDAEAQVVQPLTADWNLVTRALDKIQTGSGTRLHQGLVVAAEEVLGPARRPASLPVVVLLSDGHQSEGVADLLSTAAVARQAGIVIYTVGFGHDVDRQLLAAVAGHAGRTFMAPDGPALQRIYAQIGGSIGCR